VPEKPSLYSPDNGISTDEVPRVSLSTQDGRSIELNVDSATPHFLPPVAVPSLADSMEHGTQRVSAMPNASKRLSFITELRSKRDRSDTASLMTVDQITAEVESRRESLDVDRESDDWTKVDSEDGGDIDDLEAEDEVPNEIFDDEEEALMDDEEPAAARTGEHDSILCSCLLTFFHYQLPSGSKVLSSAPGRLAKFILEWTLQADFLWLSSKSSCQPVLPPTKNARRACYEP
jgi:hypothetical protein